MTKLRVGDIEIDERSVRIHSIATGRVSYAPPPPTGRAGPTLLLMLNRLPLKPLSLILSGIGLIVLCAAAVSFTLQRSGPLLTLIAGGALGGVGVGLVATGVLKGFFSWRPGLRHRLHLGPKARLYTSELISLLSRHDHRQTVSWIVEKTGWSEEIAVHTLGLLIARDQLTEHFPLYG